MNFLKTVLSLYWPKITASLVMLVACICLAQASSHREAPLIANDPLADNTDLYAFRSPDDPNTVTIIATYVPLQLPHGGPNYYSFGENVRYEIHVDNDASVPGDEIIYRFTFNQVNEDPTTFFNIRLGLQNLKTTYTMERSTDGGATFSTIISDGFVPPTNIGSRSIESPVGLGLSGYEELWMEAIHTTGNGEKVFCGPVDDPFFVDLGGVFDLGDMPRQGDDPRDGVACYNVSAIAIQVPISMLLKAGAPSSPTSILDSDYVIGVWASASRPKMRTLNQGSENHSGDWVQVSRLGMPLTNEVVVPIGQKDYWNAITPYDEISDQTLDGFFYNPELALYMDDALFGGAVPAFTPLRIQRSALGAFDFGNGNDGLFALKGSPAVAGTALDDAVFGSLLLPGPGMPRSVDLWPIFHTGVPNVRPYQLATGKNGDPLAEGKPFLNNFLPNGGDMLRLNMAVPVTPRGDASFSSLGAIQAAVLGLTDPTYTASADLQFIPNMDGFPNGRRLEDDVTRIELQAVSGVALAALGLWYDDFDPNVGNPVTQDLIDVLTYSTGVEKNDREFSNSFPYLATPHRGTSECSGAAINFISQTADLEISIESPKSKYRIYQEIPYEITVTNKGNISATGVQVKAALPQSTVFTSSSASKGAYDLFFENWTVGELNSGESATLDLVLFTLEETGPISNFVEVSTLNQSDPDSDPGNDTDRIADEDDEASLTITPGDDVGGNGDGIADLELSLSVDKNEYELYEQVSYTITLTNNGPDAAEKVAVAAGLPATMVFTAASASQGDYNLFFEKWMVGTLESGSSASLQLTLFTLDDSAPLTNFVQVVFSDQPDPDSSPGNNATMSPNEDDEAAIIIIPANASNMINSAALNRSAATSLLDKGMPGGLTMKVYPSLLVDGQPVNVEVESTVQVNDAQLILADAVGRVIQKKNIQLDNQGNTYVLDLDQQKSGMYLVYVVNNGQPMPAQKLVKQ